MAVVATNLTSGNSASTANSYNTSSITPTAKYLQLLSVYHRNDASSVATPSISGCGLTWTQVVTVTDSGTEQRCTIFRATGESPTAGIVTISFGGQNQTQCSWSINEFSNVDVSGTNASNAIVQSSSVIDESGSTSGKTITLSAFGTIKNAAFGCVRTGNTVTPGSGFTELSETTTSTKFQTEWAINDNTVDWTWSTTTAYILACAVEIKAETRVSYDAVSSQLTGDTKTSPYTFTTQHTCTGNDRLLLAWAYNNPAVDDNAILTYGGQTMTKINVGSMGGAYSGERLILYYLLNPPSGANSFVLTWSGANSYVGFGAISYAGIKQKLALDTSINENGSGVSSKTTTLTTTTDKCFTILLSRNDRTSSPTAGSNTKIRTSGTAYAWFDSDGIISPAGSTSLAVNFGGSAYYYHSMVSFIQLQDNTVNLPAAIVII